MTAITESKTVYVVQGTYYVSTHPEVVLSTVLGSCISVCLFDPVGAIGGMNHFLLPAGRGTDSGHIRFGVNAMEQLINELLKSHASKPRLQAKLFGGARMSAKLSDIGRQNTAFARTFLEKEGIPTTSESIGGTLARRVIFRPSTGQAKMLFVQNDEVKMNEAPPPQPGGVVMF
ncbi:MAG: chemotaxis protein CheD [Cypionkella sp.]